MNVYVYRRKKKTCLAYLSMLIFRISMHLIPIHINVNIFYGFEFPTTLIFFDIVKQMNGALQ